MTTAGGLDIQQLHAGANHDGIPKLAVGAIVDTDGRVLIMRRSTEAAFMAGIEKLPSGGVSPGENLLTRAGTRTPRRNRLDWTAYSRSGLCRPLLLPSGSGRKARQYTFGLAHHVNPSS
ncbi:hypothetical protein GWI34_16720 [Actinomadura sp. DSM 109109]|nr:hypothetical protein [Actinomadura lepetitiana]